MYTDQFSNRHIGINAHEEAEMLEQIGVSNLQDLMDQTIPEDIRNREKMRLPKAISEYEIYNKICSLIIVFGNDLDINKFKLLNNLKNIHFVYKISKQLKISDEKIFKSLNLFKALKFRKEIVYNKFNLMIINDSKSTSFCLLKAASCAP